MWLDDFFANEKTEYYAVLDYAALRVTAPRIMEREAFTPRSAVIYLIPYFTERGENISSYAVSRDYHLYIQAFNERLISVMTEKYPNAHFKGYGDRSPIDEREAAALAGLGIIGKNRMLINEKYGSYVFIAEVICDIPARELGAKKTLEVRYCEMCGKCLKACPTGALNGIGECLSSITQKKGELAPYELELMRKFNTVWGCDICQTVCPHNESPVQTPMDFFRENVVTRLDEETLSVLGDEEFSYRAYSWRGRKTVERNLKNK